MIQKISMYRLYYVYKIDILLNEHNNEFNDNEIEVVEKYKLTGGILSLLNNNQASKKENTLLLKN